jgi:hypothetical protein
MNRLHSIALLILGLIPVIAGAIVPLSAIAGDSELAGCYKDREWQISVSRQNNTYRYQGQKIGSTRSIQLAGATVSRVGSRQTYTWNNGGTKYQVVWKNQDPDFIRVRVITPNGKEVLNRLLAAAQVCD